MNERRREQNRNAQRRFRERVKKSTDQSRVVAMLQKSQQCASWHHPSFGTESGMLPTPSLTPPQDHPVGGSDVTLWPIYDTTLHGPRLLLDDTGPFGTGQAQEPPNPGHSSAVPLDQTMTLSVTPPESVIGQPSNAITPVEGRRQSSSHGHRRGTSQRQPGTTGPLHIAAQKGRCSIARSLLEHRADPNLKDSNGLTPLLHATIQGHIEMMCLCKYDDLSTFCH
ncbi:hypothetical protein F4823DRAFT_361564 [Ustulina deusta]|nr:hypothetical protein F4823DRAFT_361564 [Ustulina deusta]